MCPNASKSRGFPLAVFWPPRFAASRINSRSQHCGQEAEADSNSSESIQRDFCVERDCGADQLERNESGKSDADRELDSTLGKREAALVYYARMVTPAGVPHSSGIFIFLTYNQEAYINIYRWIYVNINT